MTKIDFAVAKEYIYKIRVRDNLPMKQENEHLKGIPKEGFLKIRLAERAPISSSQRIALVRKGNELFNLGRVEEAKKIFITTRYGDGLTRLGDYYWDKGEPLEALRMYWIAPSPNKRDQLVERAAGVVRSWIVEGTGNPKRFDGDTTKHHHFQCLKCKKVFDVHYAPYDNLEIPPKMRECFQVLRTNVHLEGYCEQCQEQSRED